MMDGVFNGSTAAVMLRLLVDDLDRNEIEQLRSLVDWFIDLNR